MMVIENQVNPILEQSEIKIIVGLFTLYLFLILYINKNSIPHPC